MKLPTSFHLLRPAVFVLAAAATLSALTAAPLAYAQTQHTEKQVKEDIQRHRAMAAAHEGAARCLEGGKKEDVCMKELLAACKGLAIGKYCGMKHAH